MHSSVQFVKIMVLGVAQLFLLSVCNLCKPECRRTVGMYQYSSCYYHMFIVSCSNDCVYVHVFFCVKAVPLAEYFVCNHLINYDDQSLTAHAEHHQLVVTTVPTSLCSTVISRCVLTTKHTDNRLTAIT